MLSPAAGSPLLVVYMGGFLSDRIGTRFPQLGAMILLALSLVMLALSSTELLLTVVIISLVLVGVSSGLFDPANYSSVMGSVPGKHLGMAGGIYNTVDSLSVVGGIVLADAAMGTWDELKGVALGNPGFQSAIQNECILALIIVLAGIVAFISLSRKKDKNGDTETI